MSGAVFKLSQEPCVEKWENSWEKEKKKESLRYNKLGKGVPKRYEVGREIILEN